MEIPILKGIYTDNAADFRVKYPRNLEPVLKQTGLSNGYLRPGYGIVSENNSAPGIGRGGINWNNVTYRVLGTKLCSVDIYGNITQIGDVGSGGQCTLDYSFDYLGICSGTRFYLYDGTTLTQVTDPDLGNVFGHIWVDGYFMLTDGEFVVVTDINNPFSVSSFKYASSEADPDPIEGILKIINEPYIINRFTIEVFDNIGGVNFPFQRVQGAQIQKGAVGKSAFTRFYDRCAFVGSGRDEEVGVYLTGAGQTIKLSTEDIDQTLNEFTEQELAQIIVEKRKTKGVEFLYIHLPNCTLVFNGLSITSSEKIWHTLDSGIDTPQKYKAKDFVYCYNKWTLADPTQARIGYYTDEIANHWGQKITWEFNTPVIYNKSKGAIVHELELVSIPGRNPTGTEPNIYTYYSLDGQELSQKRYKRLKPRGDREQRINWLNQGPMRSWRSQYFGGDSDAMLSVGRLEARIEPLKN